jgi:hypothetical protein
MSAPLAQEIAAVRRSLAALDRALVRLAREAGEVRSARGGAVAKPPRRKLSLTPTRRRALQLHGRYLGYVRRLSPRAKAQVKALREKKGIRVAIAKAKRLAAA